MSAVEREEKERCNVFVIYTILCIPLSLILVFSLLKKKWREIGEGSWKRRKYYAKPIMYVILFVPGWKACIHTYKHNNIISDGIQRVKGHLHTTRNASTKKKSHKHIILSYKGGLYQVYSQFRMLCVGENKKESVFFVGYKKEWKCNEGKRSRIFLHFLMQWKKENGRGKESEGSLDFIPIPAQPLIHTILRKRKEKRNLKTLKFTTTTSWGHHWTGWRRGWTKKRIKAEFLEILLFFYNCIFLAFHFYSLEDYTLLRG